MKYVYIIQSISQPDEYYTGITDDFNKRLKAHNAGKSFHTTKHFSWKVVVVICFADRQRAIDFELYLKSGSGRAFALKHFRSR